MNESLTPENGLQQINPQKYEYKKVFELLYWYSLAITTQDYSLMPQSPFKLTSDSVTNCQ